MRKTLLTNDCRMSIICKAFYFTDGCGYVFEKDLRFNLLYDLYGALLNEHRSDIFSLYYAEDLSLSEIAEDTGLSRQGVRASVKKTEEELLEYEAKLHLAERTQRLRTDGASALGALEELKSSVGIDRPDDTERIERIEQFIRTVIG